MRSRHDRAAARGPDPAGRRSGSSWAPAAALAAVLAVAAGAYALALPGEFVLDDDRAIDPRALRRPDAIRIPSLPELLGPTRPVTEITFALDWRAARLDPRRYHVVSLLAHLAVAALAFAFVRRLARRAGHDRPSGVAVVAAGLLALHPIQAEAVAYAAQRSELLASGLYLGALLLLDEAAARWRRWSGAAAWVGAAAAWIAGMGAKTIAITAPAAFVLDQAVVAPPGERGGRPARRRVLRALALAAPLLALAAWSAALHLRYFEANPAAGAGATGSPIGAGAYFLTQLRVHWLYLRLLAWPRGLAFDRSFEPSLGVDGSAPAAGLATLGLLGLAVALWVRAERAPHPRPADRLAAFGILFWFLVLSPTSTVVPTADFAVEHRVYLAALGPFLTFTVAADAILRRWLPPARRDLARAAAAACLLAGCAALLAARARVWSSAEALYRDAAAASPDNPRILLNLGQALRRKGDLAGADAVYRQAWGVVRAPALVAKLARNHAALFVESGHPDVALTVVDLGLPAAPDDPELHGNRASALSFLGRHEEALAEARRAVALDPRSAVLRGILGHVLLESGASDAALSALDEGARLDPDDPRYDVMRASALGRLGRAAEACAALRRAASLSGGKPLPEGAYARSREMGCGVERPR